MESRDMGVRKYTDEQVRKATDMFFGGMSQTEVCRALGYPSRPTMSRWVAADPRRAGRERVRPQAGEDADAGASAKKSYPFEVRLEAVRLAEDEHLTRREVADRLGICAPAMVSKWVTVARKKGRHALMPKREKRELDAAAAAAAAASAPPDDVRELRRQNEQLRMDVAILEETIKALKKDPGVDPGELSNREKAAVVDALRNRFALKGLLGRLGLARSTYYYERTAIAAGDKYAELRKRVSEVFHAARDARGYRYVTAMLRRGDEPVVVSEKVVRRIMREDGLAVLYNKKAKRYSSYVGEVSEAPDNLVRRNFHADAPNELWLTDITEFRIPAGKVYLSPILDCYEGYLPAWSIGQRPTAELANSSLRKACATLGDGERPTEHSDRGGHYRWPGWVSICDEYGLTRSMSAKGCSPDNSACEGLFGRIKNEFFYHRDWSGVSLEDFASLLDGYLVYYNEERPKESLGWVSPARRRAMYYEGVAV